MGRPASALAFGGLVVRVIRKRRSDEFWFRGLVRLGGQLGLSPRLKVQR